jgi:hypothetical protein
VVSVYELIALEGISRQKCCRIRPDKLDIRAAVPRLQYALVDVDADVRLGGPLVAHDSPAAKMGFDVHPVRRDLVDEPLIDPVEILAARVSHWRRRVR